MIVLTGSEFSISESYVKRSFSFEENLTLASFCRILFEQEEAARFSPGNEGSPWLWQSTYLVTAGSFCPPNFYVRTKKGVFFNRSRIDDQ